MGLDAIGANLLTRGHAGLGLDAVVPNLLTLDASGPGLALYPGLPFDPSRPSLMLNASLTFDPSRPSLALNASLPLDARRALALDSEALLALHTLRGRKSASAAAPFDVERLPRRRTPLGGLRAFAPLRRGLLALDLVGIAVIAARASRSRRGNRQRSDAGSEE